MGRQIVCFLIDDDIDDQEIFELAVAATPYQVQVRAVNDGFSALELVKNEPDYMPDFIFLDLNMPRLDGKQCLVALRKMERFKEVPVIIYSTSSQKHHKEEVAVLGATDFVTKPSEIPRLTEILNQIFEQFKPQ